MKEKRVKRKPLPDTVTGNCDWKLNQKKKSEMNISDFLLIYLLSYLIVLCKS